MGLLNIKLNEKLMNVAVRVNNGEIDKQEVYKISYTKAYQQIMFEGTLDHIICLKVAVALDQEKMYLHYAHWLYGLLFNKMKFMGEKLIKIYLNDHYNAILNNAHEILTKDSLEKGKEFITKAIEYINTLNSFELNENYIDFGAYAEYKKNLLQLLLEKDTYHASIYIKNLAKDMPLEELYTDIIQKTMQEVGELWHQNKISVAQEHYCTAAMQNILSQFYEVLYKAPRQEKKAIVACPGTELHEMGARMIADLFTNNGWDSIYLGSAVPVENILDVITEEKPQVCALSASMPQGIEACLSTIKLIKEQFPNIIVCVGGRAFDGLEDIEEKMGADIYSEAFPELKEKLSKFAL